MMDIVIIAIDPKRITTLEGPTNESKRRGAMILRHASTFTICGVCSVF